MSKELFHLDRVMITSRFRVEFILFCFSSAADRKSSDSSEAFWQPGLQLCLERIPCFSPIAFFQSRKPAFLKTTFVFFQLNAVQMAQYAESSEKEYPSLLIWLHKFFSFHLSSSLVSCSTAVLVCSLSLSPLCSLSQPVFFICVSLLSITVYSLMSSCCLSIFNICSLCLFPSLSSLPILCYLSPSLTFLPAWSGCDSSLSPAKIH